MKITHWCDPLNNGKITAISNLTYEELIKAMDFLIENEPPKFFFTHHKQQGIQDGGYIAVCPNENYEHDIKHWTAIKEALQAEIRLACKYEEWLYQVGG